MATVTDIVKACRTHLKQCPDITIEKAVRRALREFCTQSWYYQKTLVQNGVADQQTYMLDLDSDDEIVAIVNCEYKDRPLQGVRQQDYSVLREGQPNGFQYEPPFYLLLSPVPSVDETDAIKVRLALQLSETATTIPEVIYRHHKQTLEFGAMAYVLSMPEERWTNFPLAQEYERRFQLGIFDAKRMRHRGFVSGSLQIRPRGFL